MAVIFGIFIVGALIVYTSFSWGFVLYNFWYWFLLPVFPNLPLIDFWQAIGLMLLIGLFKGSSEVLKDEVKDTKSTVGLMFIRPWLSLLVGWIIVNII